LNRVDPLDDRSAVLSDLHIHCSFLTGMITGMRFVC